MIEEKTHISETKIRFTLFLGLSLVILGVYSTEFPVLHVLPPGQILDKRETFPDENMATYPTSDSSTDANIPVQPNTESELVKKLTEYSRSLPSESNITIPETLTSNSETLLTFEKYESYLKRNPGTPQLYLNAAILAFNLGHDNLGMHYLDQAILLDPDLAFILE